VDDHDLESRTGIGMISIDAMVFFSKLTIILSLASLALRHYLLRHQHSVIIPQHDILIQK